MTKSLSLFALAMMTGLSAHAKQNCPEINGTFHNIEKKDAAASQIRSIPYSEGMIYSLVGLTDGTFYADGKAHNVGDAKDFAAVTTCTKDAFVVTIRNKKDPKVSGVMTVQVLNDRGDLMAKVVQGNTTIQSILAKDASEPASCTK